MLMTAFHISAPLKQRVEELYPAAYKSFGEAVRDGLREILDWLEELKGVEQEDRVAVIGNPSKTQMVSFKVPAELLEHIKKLAEEEGVSLSEFLRSCITYTLRRRYRVEVREI